MSKKVILCLENELFMKNNLLFTEKEDFIVRKISSQEFERGPVLMSYGALLHCTRGSAKVEINEHSYILEANTNINIVPNDIVAVIDASTDLEVLCFAYTQDFFQTACLNLERGVFLFFRQNPSFKDQYPISSWITNIFSMLFDINDEHDCRYRVQMAQLQFRFLLMGYYNYVSRNFPSVMDVFTSNRSQEHFKRFMQSVSQHYLESREVLFYANELCISPKHLNNIVTKISNHTAKEVIDRFVITRLKNTLMTTELTIAEICDMYNFPNQSFMSRYFKKHTSLSPGQFRKRER